MSQNENLSEMFFRICKELQFEPETIVRNAITHLGGSSGQSSKKDHVISNDDDPILTCVEVGGTQKKIYQSILFPKMKDLINM
jgi:hypothetical protein